MLNRDQIAVFMVNAGLNPKALNKWAIEAYLNAFNESYAAGAKDMQERNTALTSALNAMLTQFGMDEDEWNIATFKQARKALEIT